MSAGRNDDGLERELRDISRRLISAANLARKPTPIREYIVEGIILANNLTLLSGNGGTGKTTIAMQLAVAMQIDGEWLGMRVKQGPALAVTSEEDEEDVHLALLDIAKTDGKSLAHLPDLYVLPLSDRDSCMAAASGKFAALTATPLWRALEDNIERLKPRLVILDALADLFGGEENFRRHARDFVVLLKRLAHHNRLAVILIAHPSIVGMNSGSGLSGSTDWHNGPRGRLYVETPLGDDRRPIDPKNRTLTVKKAQHSDAEGTVYKLRWEKGAYRYMGGEGGSAPYDKAAASFKADRVFLALLSAYEDQGRTVSHNSGANYAPKVFSEDEDAEGVRKEAFAKAMGRLFKANRIHIETIGPPSKQRKQLDARPRASQGGSRVIRRHRRH
jgi:RecA-family ATPase